MRRTEGCGPTAASSVVYRVGGHWSTYLNLQKIITADALVVHLVVRIISITARFILNEREARDKLLADAFHNKASWGKTYRRLEAERGAGISQRTRRPYLREDVRLRVYCRVAEGRKTQEDRWSDVAGGECEGYLQEGTGWGRSIDSDRGGYAGGRMRRSRDRCARRGGREGGDDRSASRIVVDVPFELVGKVAGARAVAEASDVERGAAAARHLCKL